MISQQQAHGDHLPQQPHPVSENPLKEYLDLQPFRLLSQFIEVSNIDFDGRILAVHSKFMLIATDSAGPDDILCLHIGKNVYLPGENENSGVVQINGIHAKYFRQRMGEIKVAKKELQSYISSLEDITDTCKDQDYLIIKLPQKIPRNSQFFCTIDVKVVNPSNVYFHVKKNADDLLISPSHCYTYKSAIGPTSCEWVPCFDDMTQLCTFELSIRVSPDMTAIASGLHTKTVVHPDKFITYHFRIDTPTSICNVGFAVGFFSRFEPEPLTKLKTIFSCPDEYLGLVKNSVERVETGIEFFEKLFQLPLAKLNFAFVFNLPVDVVSFFGLVVLPVNILYPKAIVDVARDSRQLIVRGIAVQYFGCFIQPQAFTDAWFVYAIARFLELLYIQSVFGLCEYDFQIYHIVRNVCDYECRTGMICLVPDSSDAMIFGYFGNPTNALTMSDTYFEMAIQKGLLIVRMIYEHFGNTTFMNVLNTIFTTAKFCAKPTKRLQWYHMTLSYSSFCVNLFNLTTQQIPEYINQWLYTGGHAQFDIFYSYDEKRNAIEIKVKQSEENGAFFYKGPLTVTVQEIEESFNHVIQIDKKSVCDVLQCHAKIRSAKRRKVMTSNKRDVYIDFATYDFATPILWIRIDPDLRLICEVKINQPLINLEYMLLYESNISAQLHTIAYFYENSIISTLDSLNKVITEARFYYKTRIAALNAQAYIQSKFESDLHDTKSLIQIFKKLYGCRSDPFIAVPNKVVIIPSSLINYEFQKGLILTLAKIRQSQGYVCPPEIVKFLVNLLRLNDNSYNRYSDDFLRATHIEALRLTLTKSTSTISSIDSMPETVKMLYDEVHRAFNTEILKPSYNRVILIACLSFFSELFCLGYLPFEDTIFLNPFILPKINSCQVRVTAVICKVKIVAAMAGINGASALLPGIIQRVITDSEPQFVRQVLKQLAAEPPFQHSDFSDCHTFPLNTELLRRSIWAHMIHRKTEHRVRMLIADLYFAMFGYTELKEVF